MWGTELNPSPLDNLSPFLYFLAFSRVLEFLLPYLAEKADPLFKASLKFPPLPASPSFSRSFPRRAPSSPASLGSSHHHPLDFVIFMDCWKCSLHGGPPHISFIPAAVSSIAEPGSSAIIRPILTLKSICCLILSTFYNVSMVLLNFLTPLPYSLRFIQLSVSSGKGSSVILEKTPPQHHIEK